MAQRKTGTAADTLIFLINCSTHTRLNFCGGMLLAGSLHMLVCPLVLRRPTVEAFAAQQVCVCVCVAPRNSLHWRHVDVNVRQAFGCTCSGGPKNPSPPETATDKDNPRRPTTKQRSEAGHVPTAPSSRIQLPSRRPGRP